jgi:hypothetical protein
LRTVFICSPYRGDVEFNTRVARLLCREALARGLAPFAPHLLYPQMLDDSNEIERALGIASGLEFIGACDEFWSYEVFGVTEGMKREMEHARSLGKTISHFRRPLDYAENAEVAKGNNA